MEEDVRKVELVKFFNDMSSAPVNLRKKTSSMRTTNWGGQPNLANSLLSRAKKRFLANSKRADKLIKVELRYRQFFAQSIASVRWLVLCEGSVTIPRWNDWNIYYTKQAGGISGSVDFRHQCGQIYRWAQVYTTAGDIFSLATDFEAVDLEKKSR